MANMATPILISSTFLSWAQQFGRVENTSTYSFSITSFGETEKFSYEFLGRVNYTGSLDDLYDEVQQLLNFTCRSFQLKPLRQYNSWRLEKHLSQKRTGSTYDDAIDVIPNTRHACEKCGHHYPTRLLCHALYSGSFELFEKAVEWGAQVNEVDEFGSLDASILISASMLGKYKYVELLLKKGADVTAVNIAGANALINAVYSARMIEDDPESDYDKTINLLLDYKSPIKIDYSKCQPQYREGSCYSEDIIKMARRENQLTSQTIARLQRLKG